MKYNIKVNEVKSEDSQLRAFATVTFGDSLVVRNIAIIERRDNGTYFVSMPSYRTNEVTEKGEPIYRDICNPITKEFYEELTKNILNAFENRKSIGKEGLNVGENDPEALNFSVKVTPIERDDSSLRGIGRVFLNDRFVVGNVRLIEGEKGMFVSMPDYRTDRYKDGKPIYREIVFPITKEFREKLFGAFEKEYAAEKTKSKEKADPEPEKNQEKAISKKAKAEKEPALAR